jgi:hypothetical protein
MAGWVVGNETVIVGMDANQNISDPSLRARFHKAGLVEAISRHHSPDTPPALYNRNQSNIPIDGVWVSSQVQVLLCGYGAFDAVNDGADHRVLWMDIPLHSILGYSPQRLYQRVPRRLHSDNPRLVQRYLRRLKEKYRNAKIPQLLQTLEELRDQYWNGAAAVGSRLVGVYNELHTTTNAVRLDL